MSVSEEAEPVGAGAGFSLDISPWKQGGEERSPLSLTPAQQDASAASQKTIQGEEGRVKNTERERRAAENEQQKKASKPYPPENV